QQQRQRDVLPTAFLSSLPTATANNNGYNNENFLFGTTTGTFYLGLTEGVRKSGQISPICRGLC
ncbi:MAG: hypothetical protein V2A76_16970, partial [Planctomycetota bacterium]